MNPSPPRGDNQPIYPPLLGGDRGVGKTMRKIIPYNPKLVAYAKELRKNMTLGEIALWREIKGKKLGVRFSRQIPIDQYIVDFYCKDLQLAIEVDLPTGRQAVRFIWRKGNRRRMPLGKSVWSH